MTAPSHALFRSHFLRTRHYTLAGGFGEAADNLWVSPAKRRIAQYREKHGDEFALIMWHSRASEPLSSAYVMPFHLIAECFRVPTNRGGDAWDANVIRGMFNVAGGPRVDVRHCRATLPTPGALLAATEESQVAALLARLAG